MVSWCEVHLVPPVERAGKVFFKSYDKYKVGKPDTLVFSCKVQLAFYKPEMYTFQMYVEHICITVMGCGEIFDAEVQGLVQMCIVKLRIYRGHS